MSTARNSLTAILESPASGMLGQRLVTPGHGFDVTGHGCETSNCRVSATSANAFVQALDSLDVVVFIHYEGNGALSESTFTQSQRARIQRFFRERGVVSVHATTYGNGGAAWPQWDSLHGARGHSQPFTDRLGTIRLDTGPEIDTHREFLNRGLPDTARIVEEWLSFATDGNAIRSTPGLKVTLRLDENSVAGGLAGARAMGADHPLSWYRTFEEGGRFFYTALGHRPQHYLGTGTESSPATAMFRRQLYNAILWAAKVDSNGVVAMHGASEGSASEFSGAARISNQGRVLMVSVLQDGSHTVEISGVDGRRVAVRRGAAQVEYGFTNLGPGVHLVTVTTPHGRQTRRVMIP